MDKPTSPQPVARNERPILIFGAPRSGTSLLSRLLDAHSRIAIPFESHLFNQWHPRLGAYGDLSNPQSLRNLIGDIISFGVIHDWEPRPKIEEVLARVDEPTFAGVGRAFLQNWASHQLASRWGEKTPHHTLYHQEVLQAWPDALVIIIRRDPRSVALSWKSARFGGNHVIAFAKAWKKYAAACDVVRDVVSAENCIDVTYEDLVTTPQAELERLMEFLGEEFEAQQLAFHENGEEWKTDSRNAKKLRQPITASSIDLWRTGLSPKEIRLIETICGAEMDALGYEVEGKNGKASSGALRFAAWVEYPVMRVVGLTKNARGMVYKLRDVNWRRVSLCRRFGGRFRR